MFGIEGKFLCLRCLSVKCLEGENVRKCLKVSAFIFNVCVKSLVFCVEAFKGECLCFTESVYTLECFSLGKLSV